MVTVVNNRRSAPDFLPNSPGLSSLFSQVVQQQQDRRGQNFLNEWLRNGQMQGRNAFADSAIGQAMGQNGSPNGAANSQMPQNFDVTGALDFLINKGVPRDQALKMIAPYQAQQQEQNKMSLLQQLAQDPSQENFYKALPFLDAQTITAISNDQNHRAVNAREQAKPKALTESQKELSKNELQNYQKIQSRALEAKENLKNLNFAREGVTKGTQFTKYWTREGGKQLEAAIVPFYERRIAQLNGKTDPASIALATKGLPNPSNSNQVNEKLIDDLEREVKEDALRGLIYRDYQEAFGDTPGWTETAERDVQAILRHPEAERLIPEFTRELLSDEERQEIAQDVRGNQNLIERTAPAVLPDRQDGSLMQFVKEPPMTSKDRLKKKNLDEKNATLTRKGILFGEGALRQTAATIPDTITALPRALGQGAESLIDHKTGTSSNERDQARADKDYKKIQDTRVNPTLSLFGYEDDIFGDEFAPGSGTPLVSFNDQIEKARDAVVGDKFDFTPNTFGERVAQGTGEIVGNNIAFGRFSPNNVLTKEAAKELGLTSNAKGLSSIMSKANPKDFNLAKEAIKTGTGALGYGLLREAGGDSEIGRGVGGLTGLLLGEGLGGFIHDPRATFGRATAAATGKKSAPKFAPVAKSEAQELGKLADKYDIRLSGSTLSNNKVLNAWENRGSRNPLTAAPFEAEAKHLQKQFGNVIEKRVLEPISNVSYIDAKTSGNKIQKAGLKALDDSKALIAENYGKADALLRKHQNFSILPTKTVESIDELKPQFNVKRTAGGETKVVKVMGDLENDIARYRGRLPAQVAQNYRRTINALVGEPDVIGGVEKQLYKISHALEVDLGEAARIQGDWGKDLNGYLAEGSRLTKQKYDLFDTKGGRILVDKGIHGEEVLKYVTDVSSLEEYESILGPKSQAYNELRRAKITELTANVETDGLISPAKVATLMTDKRKQALLQKLTGNQYEVMKDLGTMTSVIKERARYLINPSDSGIVTETGKQLREFSRQLDQLGSKQTISDPVTALAKFSVYLAKKVGYNQATRALSHPTFKAAYKKAYLDFEKTGVFNKKLLESLLYKLAPGLKKELDK